MALKDFSLIFLRVVVGDEKFTILEVIALMNHAKERIKLSLNIYQRSSVYSSVSWVLLSGIG
jgi:hypothetical protein